MDILEDVSSDSGGLYIDKIHLFKQTLTCCEHVLHVLAFVV